MEFVASGTPVLDGDGGEITPGSDGGSATPGASTSPPSPLSLPPAPPLPLPPLPPPLLPPPPPHAPRERMWAEGEWGVFSFTWKPPRSERHPNNTVHGALQASCPFHKKNSKTGCKKSITCLGPTRRDQEVSLLRLKVWCNNATKLGRQKPPHFKSPTGI